MTAALVEALRARDGARAMALLERRLDGPGDVGSLLLGAVEALVAGDGDRDAFTAFCAACPDDFGLRGILEYGQACLAVGDGDLAAVVRLLRDAARHAVQAQDLFVRDRGFLTGALPIFVQQAFLAEGADYAPSACLPPPVPAPLAAPPPAGVPVVVAACNGAYFDLFFAAFHASLGQWDPAPALHLHVVNPTAAGEAAMAALDGDGAVAFTREASDQGAPYFAGARFLVLEALLDHYRRPLVVSDIDVEFRRPPGEVLAAAAAAGADLAYFAAPSPSPSLTYHAQLTVFADSTPARRIARETSAYLRAKVLEKPVWTVDQVGLMRAVLMARADPARPARIHDLNQDFGHIGAVQEVQDMPLAAKRNLRGLDDGRLRVTFDDQGKPLIQSVA